MTRQEQIKEVAQKEMSKYPNFCITAPAFRLGAEWADSHPDIDVRTMTAYQAGYKAAVEKACEWLTRELCYTARGNNFFNNKIATDEFVKQFKKAMKGE